MVIPQPDRILLQEQVGAALAVFEPGPVLDLGGGSFNRYLSAAKGFQRVSLDIAVANRPDVIADVHQLPLRTASFPCVLCTQVLEHVQHPRRVIQQISRVLRPDGALLLTVPQWNELHEEPHDYYRYTCYGLRQLVEEAGLDVVRIEQRGAFWAQLGQILVRYCIDRWDLYHSPLGRILRRPLGLVTRILLWVDRHDGSIASRKHTMGWLLVARKPDIPAYGVSEIRRSHAKGVR